MLDFREAVLDVVRRIPRGCVSTYSDVARLAGKPRNARQVGWALASISDEDGVPWWRVIQKAGTLPEHRNGPNHQADLLRAEGVTVLPGYRVDLTRYGWDE